MKRLLSAMVLVAFIPGAAIAAEVSEDWKTVAGKSDFRETSTFAETRDFLRRVESRAPRTIRVMGAPPEGIGR